MKAQHSASKLQGIQALRGIAAMAVVFTHSITRITMLFPDRQAESWFRTASGGQWTVGDAGVDLFFAISGFIMLYIHGNDFGRDGAQLGFIRKRALRIVPLYWLMTSLAIGLMLAAPTMLANQRDVTNIGWLASSYLLLPYPSGSGILSPVVGVGWTLVYEAFFYWLFVVALGMSQANGIRFLTIMLCGLVLGGVALRPENFFLRFATNPLLLDFLAGALIGRFMVTGGQVPRTLSWVLGGVSALVIVATIYWPPPEHGLLRCVLWGVPTALIVLVANNARVPANLFGKAVSLLGDASYSIYLFQFIALPACGFVIRRLLGNHIPFNAEIFILTLLVTMSGIGCWYFVERPLGRVFSTRPRPQLAPISGEVRTA